MHSQPKKGIFLGSREVLVSQFIGTIFQVTQELGSDTLCTLSETTLSQRRWGRAQVPGDTVGIKPSHWSG